MYAQLCNRLHNFSPAPCGEQTKEPRQNITFKRILVKKCQEEFDNRISASTAYEKCNDGLSPEEVEQRENDKRKMLGNIKFIGELFKLGMLHESIMHQCIKELLERKKHQQVADMTENIECLCNLLKTVGRILDVEKAQGWMNQYFKRMSQLSTNEELPPRYRFMLQAMIELRDNQWIPRRLVDTGPRTIREIREESRVMQAGYSPSRGSPVMPHFYPIRPGPPIPSPSSFPVNMPPPPLPIRGGAPSTMPTQRPIMPTNSGPIMSLSGGARLGGPNNMSHPGAMVYMMPPRGPPPPAMGYFSLQGPSRFPIRSVPPAPVADEGFIRSSLAVPEDDPVVHPKDLRLLQHSVPSSTSVSRHASAPTETAEKKQPKMLQPIKLDKNVSLRPSGAPMKAGAGSKKPSVPQPAANVVEEIPPQEHLSHHSTMDSSDDEDTAPRKTAYSHDMSSQHSIPPFATPPRFPSGHAYGGMPTSYYGPAGYPGQPPTSGMHYNQPGIGHMMQMPSVSSNAAHHLYQRSRMPVPHHMEAVYRPSPVAAPPSSLPPYHAAPAPPMHLHGLPPPPLSEAPAMARPFPPAPPNSSSLRNPSPAAVAGNSPLDRLQIPIKYVGSKAGKKAGTSGGHVSSGSAATRDNENSLEFIVSRYLDTLDKRSAVADISKLDVSGKTICLILMTKFLAKSEDDRIHVSNLMHDALLAKKLPLRESFLEAFREVLQSMGAGHTMPFTQYKVYIAGFAARAIAQDIVQLAEVVALFTGGQHHLMMLTILQALLPLVGEKKLEAQFKSSKLHLTSFLPKSIHSHQAIVQLLETQFKNLEFLYPLRRVEKELMVKLKQETTAPPIYKWIKTNVDASFYVTSDFVMVLTTCLLDHIAAVTWLKEVISADQLPSKQSIAEEQQLIHKFKVLVQKFVHDSIPLQISAIYATQIFCHKHHFPKGLLLRLFSYWYDLDVIEEDAFLKWKEDVSHNFDGKGEALFQVNQWLMWLAEPDDDSDDEET